MLVLSRKRSESLVIGSDVHITVLRIDRNQVRLGIVAPEKVTILRAELVGADKPARNEAKPQGAETLPAAVI